MVHNLMELIVKICLTVIAVAMILLIVGFLLSVSPIVAIIAIGLGVYVNFISRNK